MCVCVCVHACALSHTVMSGSFVTPDYNPPDSSVYGIFQARILDWVAISSSRQSFPTQGLNSCLFVPPALAGEVFIPALPGKPQYFLYFTLKFL